MGNYESTRNESDGKGQNKFSDAKAIEPVHKITSNTVIKITKDMRSGPATLAQKMAWRRFWQRIISEVKADDSR